MRFILKCFIIKPEEDETNVFFHSKTEINIEATDEKELLERRADEMLNEMKILIKTVAMGCLMKSFRRTYKQLNILH